MNMLAGPPPLLGPGIGIPREYVLDPRTTSTSRRGKHRAHDEIVGNRLTLRRPQDENHVSAFRTALDVLIDRCKLRRTEIPREVVIDEFVQVVAVHQPTSGICSS
jgi:hypothetical protein